jgi:membrane dipeptidase
MILEHMAHIIHVVGDEFVSIGTDYDGMISPPTGLSDPHYPLLVAQMLERNWSHERIQRILGGNFLRSFKALRP